MGLCKPRSVTNGNSATWPAAVEHYHQYNGAQQTDRVASTDRIHGYLERCELFIVLRSIEQRGLSTREEVISTTLGDESSLGAYCCRSIMIRSA